MVVKVLDPADTQDFYRVIYNDATGVITARTDAAAFAPASAFVRVPAAGWAGLMALVALLGFAGCAGGKIGTSGRASLPSGR